MPIAAGFSLERTRHKKSAIRGWPVQFVPEPRVLIQNRQPRPSSAPPRSGTAHDSGSRFRRQQAAKRFGAPAKPFSEAREDKLSPVNKTVARETSMGANDAASGNAASMGIADVSADNCQCRHVFDHLPSD